MRISDILRRRNFMNKVCRSLVIMFAAFAAVACNVQGPNKTVEEPLFSSIEAELEGEEEVEAEPEAEFEAAARGVMLHGYVDCTNGKDAKVSGCWKCSTTCDDIRANGGPAACQAIGETYVGLRGGKSDTLNPPQPPNCFVDTPNVKCNC
jgi:hypothetical protein